MQFRLKLIVWHRKQYVNQSYECFQFVGWFGGNHTGQSSSNRTSFQARVAKIAALKVLGLCGMRTLFDFVFLALFFFFFIVWLLAWTAFHVAGGAIHLLLLVALISLVVHLFRGRRTA